MSSWWLESLSVLLGGGMGAWCRFALSSRLQDTLLGRLYPWSPILLVNIIGCFFIGVVFAFLMDRFDGGVFLRVFFVLGLLGGFTTFSSFSMDTIKLLMQGEVTLAFMNIMLSVVGGIFATAVAYRLTLFVINRA